MGIGRVIVVLLVLGHAVETIADEHRPVEKGTFQFTPTEAESRVPERFRLAPRAFDWQAQQMETVTDSLEVWDVTFPSPVKTPEEANNTVHCEFYRSRAGGRRPGVIVLHILGGDFPLARVFCQHNRPAWRQRAVREDALLWPAARSKLAAADG